MRFVRRRAAHQRHIRKSTLVTRFALGAAALLVLLALSTVVGSFAAAATYFQTELPAVRGLRNSVAAQDSVRIYDRNGTLLYEFDQNGAQHSIPLAQIPVNVVNATVAIEDHDFWVNDGLDFTSIVRAALADFSRGHVTQGGSTITQQLIKEQILGGEVNFSRKVKEAVLALGITTQGTYSKSEILQLYLDSIPYSPTAYGIDAAAHYYFGYSDNPRTGESAAQQLDLAQASILAGIPQNPSLNDPLSHPQQARQRQRQVLTAMVQYGYITPSQAAAAYAEAGGSHFYHPQHGVPNLAPQFVSFVQQQLEGMIASGQLQNLDRSGLNVYTTLDLTLQQHTLQAMREHLFGSDTTDFAVPTLIRDDNVTNSAALIVNQHTGAIAVYAGGVDPHSQFDVISQGYRSPGSSFKPFVYATAFQKGWFPAMTVGDVPTAFWDAGTGTAYKPLDYSNTEAAGAVTLRTALDWSLNIPAVDVMQYAGIQDVQANVERMGITKWRGSWGLSSVLGSLDVTPYEMVQAYTVFANYGQYIPMHAIDRIASATGNVLFQYQTPQPVQVMDPRIAFLITSMLSDNASRAGDFGGCNPLYLDPYMGSSTSDTHYTFDGAYASGECSSLRSHRYLSSDAWPTAAKTGTAQDFTNDWTIGYTMDYTGAVWVGNNDDSPMYNIDGVSGAAPIWYSSMLYAEEATGKSRTPFPIPQGVHRATYCSRSVCTNDWFLDGTLPPSNLGFAGNAVPCVRLDQSGGWTSSHGKCQVALVHHELQNAGAPDTSSNYVGAP